MPSSAFEEDRSSTIYTSPHLHPLSLGIPTTFPRPYPQRHKSSRIIECRAAKDPQLMNRSQHLCPTDFQMYFPQFPNRSLLFLCPINQSQNITQLAQRRAGSAKQRDAAHLENFRRRWLQLARRYRNDDGRDRRQRRPLGGRCG